MSSSDLIEVEEPKPRKRRCCLSCCLGCGCLTLILIAATVYLITLLFSPRKLFTPPMMTVNDTMLQTITVSELLNEITQAEDATQQAEIILSPEQLSSLCRIGMNSMLIVENQHRSELVTELPWQVQYNKGKIEGEYSLNVGVFEALDTAINAQISILPYLDGSQEGIYIYTLKIGDVYLLNFDEGVFVDINDTELVNDPEYKKYRPGIESITIQPDNSIKIVYYPYYFRPFIAELEAILYGN